MYKPQQPNYTIEQYYRLEEQSKVKHEYYRGQIFQMAGGSANHSEIAVNCAATLREAARGRGYRVFNSDLRVKVTANGFEAYPDISLVCDEPDFVFGRTDVYTNPLLIVEVLSPSTAADDTGPKFDLYQELDSLQYYLLIASDKPLITCYTRQDARWWVSTAKTLTGQLELADLNISLPLAEIYLNVRFASDAHLDPSLPATPPE